MAQGTVPRVRSVIVVAAVAAALLLPLVATAAMGPAGTWVGKMKAPDGEEFEVTLVLDGMGATWKGTLKDPFMGEVPLQNLKVTSTRINFVFRPAGVPYPANFSGSYVAGSDRVTGTFSLRGTSRFVKFERSAEAGIAVAPELAEPAEPVRIRHDYRFALAGQAGRWAALHVVKDGIDNINNVTTGEMAFAGGLKWFALDGFNLYARYYRGGQGLTDDQAELDAFTDVGLGADSFLRLDGWEIGLAGYLGNVMMRDSKFNPYVTAAAGQVSWELTASGRGSAPLTLERDALAGTDIAVLFGIGTEYELSPSLALDFEWAWRYFMTGNEDLWPDASATWSNTHAWGLSLGLTWGFW